MKWVPFLSNMVKKEGQESLLSTLPTGGRGDGEGDRDSC